MQPVLPCHLRQEFATQRETPACCELLVSPPGPPEALTALDELQIVLLGVITTVFVVALFAVIISFDPLELPLR